MTDVAAEPGAVTAADAEAIVVRLGASRFAVELGAVAEVGNVPAVTRVPGVPGWLAGVANWRGRVLPTIDLRPLLGAEQVPFTNRSRLVVLVTDVATVGLLVDGVDGTTTITADLAPFPAVIPGAGAALVSGQLPREDGPVALLDAAAVIRLRDGLPQGRRSA